MKNFLFPPILLGQKEKKQEIKCEKCRLESRWLWNTNAQRSRHISCHLVVVPEGEDFALDGDEVASGDGGHDDDSHYDGPEQTAALSAELRKGLHVVASCHKHEDDGHHKHYGVDNDDHALVGARYL